MYDSMNEFVKLISESDSLSSIIVKGRTSYPSLSEPERMRFDHAYMFLFNNLESWLIQVDLDNSLRQEKEVLENIRGIIQLYCRHPGVIDFWENWSRLYPPQLIGLFEEVQDDA